MSVAAVADVRSAPHGIEAVKWVGFLAMVYDHLEAFAGVALPFANHIGALALPCFAVALAAGTVDVPPARKIQIAWRLFVWGAVAQVACMFVRDALPFNVLFTLGAGLLSYAIIVYGEGVARWLVLSAVLVIGAASEFSLAGVALVALLCGGLERDWSVYFALAVSVLLMPFNEWSPVASFALVGATLLLDFGPEVPRIRRIFYPLYIAQWALLAVIG